MQEGFVVGDGIGEQGLWERVGDQVGPHLVWVRNAAVFLGPSVALFAQLGEVGFGWGGADRDVDFALGQHVVGDLIVFAGREALVL